MVPTISEDWWNFLLHHHRTTFTLMTLRWPNTIEDCTVSLKWPFEGILTNRLDICAFISSFIHSSLFHARHLCDLDSCWWSSFFLCFSGENFYPPFPSASACGHLARIMIQRIQWVNFCVKFNVKHSKCAKKFCLDLSFQLWALLRL